jgi:1,4-alpha-glucan branching enzyme
MSEKNIKDLLPSGNAVKHLLEGRLCDPHSILGMHTSEKGNAVIVRVYDPSAKEAFVVTETQRLAMKKVAQEGLFALAFPGVTQHFAYKIEKIYNSGSFLSEDPYCFLPGIGDMDVYLFNAGEHHKVYEMMGAHVKTYGDIKGVLFTVWAPNAERVSVVGNFNCWDGRRHQMRLIGNSGIWELFVPRINEGELYKFEIRAKGGVVFTKLDPYARRTEMRPRTAGIVPADKPFAWTDSKWMEQRAKRNIIESPVNIYEVHLASWQPPSLRPIKEGSKDDFHSYRELAHALADYAMETGYTHVELLPICEHPFDQSWGYQVTGFYSPTARYGAPEDFAYFVDHLHSKGIGVILDWVPPISRKILSRSGVSTAPLFMSTKPQAGEHRDWAHTYSTSTVRKSEFPHRKRALLARQIPHRRTQGRCRGLNALPRLFQEPGEWIPNKYGGNENLGAISSFIRRLNELTHELHPGTMMIAEESTAWPGVSRPVYLGGLGFTFKWNMGWMHDTLEYYSSTPYTEATITENSPFPCFTPSPKTSYFRSAMTRSSTARNRFWTKCPRLSAEICQPPRPLLIHDRASRQKTFLHGGRDRTVDGVEQQLETRLEHTRLSFALRNTAPRQGPQQALLRDSGVLGG